MDRRLFLQRAALITAGAVAADQIELLERLMHQRKSFPTGWAEQVYFIGNNEGLDASFSPGSDQLAIVHAMPVQDFRRRFGLKPPILSFRKDGTWLS